MRKIFTVVIAIIVLGAISVGVGQWLSGDKNNGEGDAQQNALPTEEQAVENPLGCPAYELIATPGTWESTPEDDPQNPTSHENALLLQITRPLQAAYDEAQLKVWTTPYVAQFRNINALHEKSYDDSRQEGYAAVSAEMTSTLEQCPATKFILVGFSQGAVISGDIASDIAAGRGPVPADAIVGVHLIADGRMQRDVGTLVADHNITGAGAEIALQSVNTLIQPIVPGASMRGPRPDGFGALNEQVFNFCAPTDLVCDAPVGAINALDRARDMLAANAIHAQYATNRDLFTDGQTVPEWIVNWVRSTIG